MMPPSFSNRRLPRHRLCRRRQGFTLIELLVTIGIILILIGIVFVAGRGIFTTGKSHATHITLANLSAMLGDYGASPGFKTEPPDWALGDCSVVAPTTVAPITSFWTAPAYSTVPPQQPLPFPAPGNVTDLGAGTASNTRFASPAILNTLVVMNLIARIPASRAAIANMPPQSLLVPTFSAGSMATAGPDNFLGTTDDVPKAIIYPIGCHVQANNKFYVCLTPNSDPVPAPNSSPPAADWRDETVAPQQAPLILDAWGNPIIYVPGSGLNVLLLKSHSSYTDPSTGFAYIDQPQTVISPDKRPFFASAGPDGDFTKGDDNIYSFEQ